MQQSAHINTVQKTNIKNINVICRLQIQKYRDGSKQKYNLTAT